VPILQHASVEDRKRLLELFPSTNLRKDFPKLIGTKEEICNTLAAPANIKEVKKFIDENFSCCKQHVYIFTHGPKFAALPGAITEGEQVLNSAGVHALYVVRTKYNIVLRDPLEDTTLEFLWPIRMEMRPQYLVVRFVVLQKDPASYFQRPSYIGSRTVDEKSVLADLLKSHAGLLVAADLHKGIKKLWADGFMDSSRAKYKTPISTAQETMDEERGIKEHNPDLYGILQQSPLFTTVFQVPQNKGTVSAFSADPSNGIIGFSRYSDKKGDTDYVIEQILSNNQ
jgi:hypothetical protein